MCIPYVIPICYRLCDIASCVCPNVAWLIDWSGGIWHPDRLWHTQGHTMFYTPVISYYMLYTTFFCCFCMNSTLFCILLTFHTSHSRFTPHFPTFMPHFSHLALCMLHSRLTLASLCFTCTHCMISLLTHCLCALSNSSLFELYFTFIEFIYFI